MFNSQPWFSELLLLNGCFIDVLLQKKGFNVDAAYLNRSHYPQRLVRQVRHRQQQKTREGKGH